MKFRPLHDCMVVKLHPIPETYEGGVIIASGAAAVRLRSATVLRVGPGKYAAKSAVRIPMSVKPGDKIFFFREHLEHQQGKQIMRSLLSDLEDNLGLIREPDVLWAQPA